MDNTHREDRLKARIARLETMLDFFKTCIEIEHMPKMESGFYRLLCSETRQPPNIKGQH